MFKEGTKLLHQILQESYFPFYIPILLHFFQYHSMHNILIMLS